jgi:triosephosphate isomerase
MRRKLVIGNWKMYTTAATARELTAAVVAGLGDERRVGVALCPPFPYLAAVGDAIRGSAVLLGAQNCHDERQGAFTGEVSAPMLLDLGCRYVIIGHSERRHKLCEHNDFINRKVKAALEVGLTVILCLGETLEEREAGRVAGVLEEQLNQDLLGVKPDALSRLALAYEPVWAIGTGRNATPQQAENVHSFLRMQISGRYGEETGQALPILYGGSVKPDNAASLLQLPNVDGGLIGGASLVADQFLAIVRAAL